ncbi:MAG: hypothetical protein ABJC89_06160 [Acidobacteriota bacterium]|jgi:hypothetical protein
MANRTELEQEIVSALIDSKAVNFEAVGSIISKFGARAAKSGTDLSVIVNRHNLFACGWPGPEIGRLPAQPVENNG